MNKSSKNDSHQFITEILSEEQFVSMTHLTAKFLESESMGDFAVNLQETSGFAFETSDGSFKVTLLSNGQMRFNSKNEMKLFRMASLIQANGVKITEFNTPAEIKGTSSLMTKPLTETLH